MDALIAALTEYVANERRHLALGEAIAAYEARNGKFTDDELEAQWREDRSRSIKIGARSKSRK